jgi:hypothetical protein
MAVVTNPQRPTYQEKADNTWAYHATVKERLGLLSRVVDLTTKPYDDRAKVLLGEKQLSPLKEFVTTGYGVYENTMKEKAVADEALKNFQEAIAYLTPGNVQRTPTQEIHWVKLGVEEAYHQSEETRTKASGELVAKAEEFNALIQKTQGFLTDLQKLLGNTVYAVTVLEKTTPFGGSVWSADYYFGEGLKTYRKSLVEPNTTPTQAEETLTSGSNSKDSKGEVQKNEAPKAETPKNAKDVETLIATT